jgi:hypothetical protein
MNKHVCNNSFLEHIWRKIAFIELSATVYRVLTLFFIEKPFHLLFKYFLYEILVHQEQSIIFLIRTLNWFYVILYSDYALRFAASPKK